MGPYSEEKQTQRAARIASIILNNSSNPEIVRIWEQHLKGLAKNEHQYNQRVAKVYGGKQWNLFIGTDSPIS